MDRSGVQLQVPRVIKFFCTNIPIKKSPHPKPRGEAKCIQIVKEHGMTRKIAWQVLQITSGQNQEVLDSSPKCGISFV
jgi:hypothetical protein